MYIRMVSRIRGVIQLGLIDVQMLRIRKQLPFHQPCYQQKHLVRQIRFLPPLRFLNHLRCSIVPIKTLVIQRIRQFPLQLPLRMLRLERIFPLRRMQALLEHELNMFCYEQELLINQQEFLLKHLSQVLE
jgi:hypothetical protein